MLDRELLELGFGRNFDGYPFIEHVAEDTDMVFTALSEALRAEEALEEAKRRVPDYMAQWSEEDYYRDELHERNVAVNKFGEALAEFVARRRE